MFITLRCESVSNGTAHRVIWRRLSFRIGPMSIAPLFCARWQSWRAASSPIIQSPFIGELLHPTGSSSSVKDLKERGVINERIVLSLHVCRVDQSSFTSPLFANSFTSCHRLLVQFRLTFHSNASESSKYMALYEFSVLTYLCLLVRIVWRAPPSPPPRPPGDELGPELGSRLAEPPCLRKSTPCVTRFIGIIIIIMIKNNWWRYIISPSERRIVGAELSRDQDVQLLSKASV